MHHSYRTTRQLRRGGRTALIGAVAFAATLGSTALALPLAVPAKPPAAMTTLVKPPVEATTTKAKPPAVKAKAPAVTLAPVHANRIGLATGAVFWSETPGARDAELADLEHIGVHSVRTTFPWDSIEHSSASTDKWATADSIVADANAHHITLIAQIIGAPAWAVPGLKAGQVSDYSPNPAPYAHFVAKFAARYAPLGVKIYELGNEPNHVRAGNPTPNALTYTHLLCATYAAVKAVVPNSTVLTGGLGGMKDGANGFSGPVFASSLYADGAKNCFDGISYHPYTYPQMAPDSGTRGWTGMLRVRAIMVAAGDSGKKIWVTEYGAPTNSATAKHVTSETAQATMLTTAYHLFDTYSWAGPMCWFDYQDKGSDPTDQNDWFGLRRQNGTPKPAYAAMVSLAHDAVT